MATIHPQIRSCHKAAGITDQKDRCTSILLWHTQLPQHVLLRPFASPFWKLLEQCFDHGCDDVTWRDSVDSDTILAPFGGEVASELEHAGFTGVVCWADEALLEKSLLVEC